MPEREPEIEQHVWLVVRDYFWICAFCSAKRNNEPSEEEIGPCPAAIHRMLIHDVATEMQEVDANRAHLTREPDNTSGNFTQYARELAADASFAGEILKMALGDKPDPYKSGILGEIFREIRAERRRNKPIEGLMRLEQGVLIEIEQPE